MMKEPERTKGKKEVRKEGRREYRKIDVGEGSNYIQYILLESRRRCIIVLNRIFEF